MSVYEADEGFPRVARQNRALTAVTLVTQCCMRSIAAASRLKHQRISQIFSRPTLSKMLSERVCLSETLQYRRVKVLRAGGEVCVNRVDG